jgi:serine/threonine protein kinase/Tfp pilus assembly protein PilF
MIGETVSHYKILEKLGEGGMGVVYKARDLKLDRFVALKFLPPHVSTSEDEKKRFIHEAKAASSLDHTNICAVYEINETEDGQMFLAMAYYEGETLKDQIRRGPMKLEEAIDTAIQIAQGLTRAHEESIVHRDIKPGNIIVTKRDVVKILDFGLAKLAGKTKLTKTGTTLGTVAYMSPEQARGEKVDHRTDIWSLGTIIYEMVTGRLPFKGDYDQAVIYSITNDSPEPLTGLRTGIPIELERIVNKALEKNPAERYQNAGDLIVDLKKLKKDTESIVTPQPAEVKKKPPKRNLMKILIPAAVTVVLVLAFLILRPFIAEDVLGSAPVPIAVVSFENQTGDEAYDRLQKVVPNLLITSLEQSKYLRVTTWQRMYDLLKQAGREDVDVIDEELGFELCSMDGVDVIVTGTVTKLGDVFAIVVNVLDVHDKKILKSARSQGKGESSIYKQIDELTKEISKGVGLSKRGMATVERSVAEMTTTSLEAYHLFLRGREERFRFHFPEAIRYYKKAVALDSTFAMAYCDMGFAYWYLGAEKSRREALEKAKRYSEKATEKERLFIESVIEGDQDESIRLLTQYTRKFPRDKNGHRTLGLAYRFSNYSKAIESYNRALELDPYCQRSWNMLGYIYKDMENYQKAMECFERYAAVSPGDANPVDSMGDLYLAMGRLDEALVKYKKAGELEPGFSDYKVSYMYAMKENYTEAKKWIDRGIATAVSPGIQASGYFFKSFYAYWAGRYDLALEHLDRSEVLYSEVENKWGKGRIDWLKGWIFHERGDLDLTRNYLKSRFDFLDDATYMISYHYALGLSYLKQGKIDSAKYGLEKIKDYLPKIERVYAVWGTFYDGLLHGEILFAENRFEDAIAICENKSPIGYGYIGFRAVSVSIIMNSMLPVMKDVLARAYYRNGNIDKAVEEYEKLITFDPARPGRELIHPKYYYRLAKLYEEKGLEEKAIEKYEKFLNIWKDADEDLPEKQDARARLARLKGSG